MPKPTQKYLPQNTLKFKIEEQINGQEPGWNGSI